MKRAAVVTLLLLVVPACSGDEDGKESAVTTVTTATMPTTAAEAEPLCFRFEPIDSGASVTVVEVRDCEGDVLTLDGAPAAFPVGGTVTHAEGLRCEDDALVVLSALSDDGLTYQTVDERYAVEDGALVLTGEEAATKEAAEIEAYYRLDCPDS